MRAVDIVAQSDSDVTVAVEFVTPMRAAGWLEGAAINRAINVKTVDLYAGEMVAGRWRLNNQGIAFNKNGQLIDGEHRLRAIVKSGVTMQMVVTRGLDDAARTTIDKGRKRSLANELYMFDGLAHSTRQVAYLEHCLRLSVRHDGSASRDARLTNRDAFYEQRGRFAAGVEWAINLTVGAKTPFAQAAVAGTLAFTYSHAPEIIAGFGRRLIDGVGLEADDPAFQLREAVLSGRGSTSSGRVVDSRVALTKKTLTAARSAILHQPVKVLRPTDSSIDFFLDGA